MVNNVQDRAAVGKGGRLTHRGHTTPTWPRKPAGVTAGDGRLPKQRSAAPGQTHLIAAHPQP
ncbi:hypothetical protein E2C01_053181 [Portunus trituberculatus]|uniref:Uncharacterized protein n=1 Tax=Portunus trituberculatus TaxID=210409 RepID=A0A5B7GNS6_PORTR|nr:hypothetical protein [Portunus trituberculatus]